MLFNGAWGFTMPPNEPPPLLQRLAELSCPPMDWLWPGHLGSANLAMLDGDPGLGKSLLTLDLAARVSTGRCWPDGAPGRRPASVILIYDEDADSVVAARFNALEADSRRIFALSRSDEAGVLRLPADLERLEHCVEQTGAKLIVIDPIMAFLDRGVLLGNDADVRNALRPLAGLARDRACAILMVRHLNKQQGPQALYRGGGSIAFVAACRLGWLAGRDPHVEGRFVLAQTKNNYAPPQPSLCYRIADGPRIEWEGPSPWNANDLTSRPRARPARQRAYDFLRTFLANGPRLSREVWDASQALGIAQSTLERAKDDLHVHCQILPGKGKAFTYWRLHAHALVEGTFSPEIRESLRKLEEQWPAASPLDRCG
jgi:putative DNA primase/helicase